MWKELSEPFGYPRPLTDRTLLGDKHLHSKKRNIPKAKDISGTLKRLWNYLSQRKTRIIMVLAMVFISSTLTLLGPYMIGVAIDTFIESPVDRTWVYFLIALGVVYLLHSTTLWLQNIWMIKIAQETVFRMRVDLFQHLHRLSIPFFGKRQQGELMSRLTNDIDNVSSTLNSSVIQIFSSVLTLVGTVVIMLSLSPLLTLLTFIVVPLMVLGMRAITRRTGPLFREQQRNLGELNGFIEETLSGQRIIKSFSQEQRVMNQLRVHNEKIRQSGFWSQSISGFIPKLMNTLNNLSFALIAGVGGILVIRGEISIGVIIIFIEYARQFTRPLNDLANQWNTMLSAIAGAERVFEILDEEEETNDETNSTTLEQVKGDVQFTNVSFAYDQGNETLKNVSFSAQQGEMIALVGPTGAGKTSLIQLLARFYDPNHGEITIDGHDISTIRRESLRSHMAFVLQDSFLFEGTIRDNIRYGKLTASDNEVVEAAKLANAHYFIERMDGGYDKILMPEGAGISQGQKQLISIARAILADPSILVLDEATSSIDTVTEIKIQEGLHRLMEGRTSFVIAHRLNTIRKADQILVLKNGRLIEWGTHETLIETGGFYKSLNI
ncbi:ABC transporter ATP-binding protein [Paenibacillus crassostreae]|uniref:Multidrug ABC transporter ATP-binding protein n=1 Tax=Paenibacillus crassostreae TaxID=1763538 RepID=A0A167G376_9BACL|nr:ABC transporter ATP-binding protein [Paenibacillus crassostreae]AOZ93803.1 multidrug ABC transporter ATP-binding protein [Paenibacillus crassostreae]OAB77163.1 multidrug ABC transporter ATP-binding protein [Paenibacillus crassostreae]